MAVTVIGGLTVSTLLTLVVVPVMYTLFASSGVKRKHRKMKRLALEK
jgi:HAE1 family hydrophobic/amphiphilic exporter-1